MHDTVFTMDPAELRAAAKEHGVTVTAFLASVFIAAAVELQNADVEIKRRQKHVKIMIPVDLRRIFGGETLRNFVLYSTPHIDPRLGEYSFEELCRIVYHRMCLDISEKNMSARIYTNVRDEERMLLKITPLFLKNIVMKIVFMLFGEKKSTLTMSNLGAVKLPSPMEDYVDRLDFILSVQSTAPYNASIISYKDNLNLSIIRNIKEPRLEKALYRVLKENGIHVKIESNDR
jgi:hypothetical protein